MHVYFKLIEKFIYMFRKYIIIFHKNNQIMMNQYEISYKFVFTDKTKQNKTKQINK